MRSAPRRRAGQAIHHTSHRAPSRRARPPRPQLPRKGLKRERHSRWRKNSPVVRELLGSSTVSDLRQSRRLELMNGFLLLSVGVCSFAALTGFAQAPPAALATRFHFRDSRQTYYRVEADLIRPRATNARLDWVKAWPENGSRFPVEFGSRVELQLKPGTELRELLTESPLALSRVVASNLFILQAPDAMTALSEAQRLADQPGVLMSCPIRRRLQI